MKFATYWMLTASLLIGYLGVGADKIKDSKEFAIIVISAPVVAPIMAGSIIYEITTMENSSCSH